MLCKRSWISFSLLFGTSILSKPLAALSYVYYVNIGQRGMNPVAVANIKPWTENWLSLGSNLQPPVLKSMLS